ncbi:MAG TPA: hypothetical protein GXX67_13295 [Petrimonas sp.]|jgi:hypothetical protein|nr:hypothetical protein [Petrimonas sp.]
MKVNRFNTDNDSRHDRLVKILTDAKEAGVNILDAFADAEEESRKEGLKSQGLRLSRVQKPELTHLLGLRPTKEGYLLHPHGCDHPSLWVDENNVPQVFVFQPYQLSYEEIAKNVELCESHGLEMNISATNSWHCAGKTLLVEITKKGANINEK